MSLATNLQTITGLGRTKCLLLGLGFVVLALIAFAFYTGDPVFFLKWFFGLQADD